MTSVAPLNAPSAVGPLPPTAVKNTRVVSLREAAAAPVCAGCICQVCTCGKHKCNLLVKNDTKLEGTSEYTMQYLPHQLGVAPRRLHQQQAHIPANTPLSKDTEHRVQFKAHQLPPKLPKRQHDVSALWNQAQFDGSSVSKEDYKAWPVQPHKKPAQISSPDKLVTSPERLDAETTNKHDYKTWPVPPPYVKTRAEYVPSKAKMDGTSTHKDAFRQWAVNRPAPPPVQVYRQSQEDRDFRSENRSSFVPHPTTVRKPTVVEYHPVITKFEGVTTNKDDFKAWPIARRVQYKEKYIPQPTAALDGRTFYRDDYLPKSVPRFIHPKVKYVQPDTHFEGQSTQRADFGPKQLSRRVDFAPHNVYRPEADSRDFVTQTHLAHNTKPIILCEVIKARQMPDKKVTIGKDGHQYWTAEKIISPDGGFAAEQFKVETEPVH